MCRPCARRKSPRAPSLRFIERRVSGDRPSRSVCRSHIGGLRRGVHGHRASAFVKTMQSTSKTIGSKARESPRAVCETTFNVCPRRWPRSLYRSLASSADFRPGRGRKARACMVPSASAARLVHFARFVSPRPRYHVEIRDLGTTKSRLDGRMVTRERCLSSIEPEASSETGSFRRRAPVAA